MYRFSITLSCLLGPFILAAVSLAACGSGGGATDIALDIINTSDGAPVEVIETSDGPPTEFFDVPGISDDTSDADSALPGDGHDSAAPDVDSDGETEAVNLPPSAPVIILSPAAPTTLDNLRAELVSPAIDPEGATLTYTFTWTRDDAPTPHTAAEVPANETARGERWRVVVVANDGKLDAPPVSTEVLIGNAAPSGGAVTLDPPAVREGGLLTCIASDAYDADGDTITWEFAWYVDDVSLGVTAETLTSAHFDRGQVVRCSATPSDRTARGATIESEPVTVLNSTPTAAGATLSPALAYADSLLTCVATDLADLDSDTVVARYAWLRNSSLIENQASAVLSGAFARGDEIQCVVKPWDGTDEGPAVTSNTVTIVNKVPSIGAVTLSPASAPVCTTFTCAPAPIVDPDPGDPLLLTYRWELNGEPLPDENPTLAGKALKVGDTIQCFARASDGSLDADLNPIVGPETASNRAQVTNSPPSITGVGLSPSTDVRPGATLTCVPQGYADPDCAAPPQFVFRWYRGASLIENATGDTFDTTGYLPGVQLACQAIPFDGLELGSPKLSEPLTLSNIPPTAAIVSLSAPQGADGMITCDLVTASSDLDPLSYEWWWTINGGAPFEATQSLTASKVGHCDQVKCQAVVSDGFATTPSNTATLQLASGSDCHDDNPCSDDVCAVGGGCANIPNTLACDDGDPCTLSDVCGAGECRGVPAAAGAATISPDDVYETSTLSCTPRDHATCPFTVAWTVATRSAGSLATLTGTAFDKGEAVTCSLSPAAGGAAVASSPVTILNTLPTISSASVAPSSTPIGGTFSCQFAGWSDPDPADSTPTVDYQWFRMDGGTSAPIAGATLSNLSTTSYARGDRLFCRVTPKNQATLGQPKVSSLVTVENRAPSAPAVSIAAALGADGTVTCELDTPSTDDEVVSYSWRWTINGGAPFDASQSLTAAQVRHCDLVTCQAIANDGLTTTPSNVASRQLATGSDCNDGKVCTTDVCAVGGGCGHEANTLTCDDGNPCTVADTCAATVCVGTPAPPGTVTISPTIATETSTLSCLPGSNASCSFAVAWTVGGQARGTSRTLTGSAFSRGDEVSCSLTPLAGGASVQSTGIIIQDSPPSVSSVAIFGGNPTREGSILSCVPSGFADADGDPDQTVTHWFINDLEVATGGTLTGASFSRSDRVRCSATARAGGVDGNTVSSATQTVANTAPRLSSLTVSPSPARVTDNLLATGVDYIDDDGDPVTLDIRWYVGATQKASGPIAAGTAFRKNDSVLAEAHPFDGIEYGASVRASPVSILNSPPYVSEVEIRLPDGASVATKATPLTGVAYGGDPDGDTVTGAFVWTRGAQAIGTSTTLSTANFSRGDVITLSVTPNDGTTNGPSLTSAPTTIMNSLPSAPTVTVTPSKPGPGEALNCRVGTSSSDLDGDPLNYRIEWYNRNTLTSYVAPQATANTVVTVPASETAPSELWTCRIAAHDGLANGPSAQAEVTIGTLPSALAGALLARLDFEQSLNDISGNGHHGAVVGTAPSFIAACNGTAARFGGAGRMQLASSTALGPRNGVARTVAVWLRVNEAAGDGGQLVGQYDHNNPGNSSFFVSASNSAGNLQITGNGNNVVEATGAGSTTSFRHVAAVFDPAIGKGTIYVNGALLVTGNLAYGSNSTRPFEVGGVSSLSNFKGDLDELMVFDRALSANEVAQLASAVPCAGPVVDPCQGLTFEGCCTADGTVRWCEGGQVRESDCAADGRACGWLDAANGYYCAAEEFAGPASAPYLCAGESCPNACSGRECGYDCGQSCGTCGTGETCNPSGQCEPDRCGSIDYVGCCSGGVAVWCENNTVVTYDCGQTANPTCGWSEGLGYWCGGVNDDPSGTYPRDCDVPMCGTMTLDDSIVHRAEVPGPMPSMAWFGMGATSKDIQNSGARVDDLLVSSLPDGQVLLSDTFDDATPWLTRSGVIGSTTISGGEGRFTADWGRLERTGSGTPTGTGIELSVISYWASTTNHHDIVVHRSAASLPAWDNAWFRGAIDLGRYGAQNAVPAATFSLEPRDTSVMVSSSTPLDFTPAVGWHNQTLRFELGRCCADGSAGVVCPATCPCPSGTAWDSSLGYCVSTWTEIPTFSGSQSCGGYYTITLPSKMNEFRPRASSSVRGGFLRAKTSIEPMTEMFYSFSPNGENTTCADLWGDVDGVWSTGIRRTAGPSQGNCANRITPPPLASYLRGCGVYTFALEGRRLVPSTDPTCK
jgi:hypothetical protein